jgi:hypothetical protein
MVCDCVCCNILIYYTYISTTTFILLYLLVQDDVLLAYQIAFDLVENELQSFILKVGTWAEGCSDSCMGVSSVCGDCWAVGAIVLRTTWGQG